MIKNDISKQTIDKDSNAEKIWKAALYVRTAYRDKGKRVSDSIKKQKGLLKEFIDNEPDIEIYDIYVDDGWSGRDYNRPGFLRMMNDIQEKNVDCVIVKDMSRIGRDYDQTERLFKEIFSSMDIRLVAVNDNLDSEKNLERIHDVIYPLKKVLYDEYPRFISRKVRSSLGMKRKQGKFVGAFSPFGYKKDPYDNNHLIIDEEAANVVKDIFGWYLGGMSVLSISKRLNEMGVSNPSEYKKQHGEHYSPNLKKSKGEWTDSSVRRILKNQMYVGDMVQGVRRVADYKFQIVIRVYPEYWIIVENTHESIVSREEFEMVQNLMNKKNK